MDDFALKLTTLLGIKNLKAIQLADGCGLSRGLVSQYLSGQRQPKLKQIKRIARYLNVDIGYFIDDVFVDPLIPTTKEELKSGSYCAENLFKDLITKYDMSTMKKLCGYLKVYTNEKH